MAALQCYTNIVRHGDALKRVKQKFCSDADRCRVQTGRRRAQGLRLKQEQRQDQQVLTGEEFLEELAIAEVLGESELRLVV